MEAFWSFQWVEKDQNWSAQYRNIIDDTPMNKNVSIEEIQKDPELYAALQKMQAYAQSIADNHEYNLPPEEIDKSIEAKQEEIAKLQEEITMLEEKKEEVVEEEVK